jgi:cytoskeletal protein CcmA (bactofilin family)
MAVNEAIISEDLTIEGDLLAKESAVLVRGRVDGNVTAKAIEIDRTGIVTGTLSADLVTISGELTGRVECADLSLSDSAKVKADLSTGTLTSSRGARLLGRVEVKGR